MAKFQQYNPQTGEWEWAGQDDPVIDFGGWGNGTSTNFLQGGLGGNQVFGGQGAATPPTPPPPPPTTPTPPPPAASTGSMNPMSFFRTDYAPTYNPLHFGTNLAQQSVGNVLGNGATFGSTATAFGVPSQSITNYGGINANTGLIQNLINQYGPEQARAMVNAEAAAARAAGGGNWTLNNDASLNGYEGYRGLAALAPTSAASSSVFNAPNTFNANNYTSQASNQAAQAAQQQNTALRLQNAATGGTNSAAGNPASMLTAQSGGMDFNSLLTMLMLMGLLGGNSGGVQSGLPSVNRALTTNRNPSLYSLFY